MSYEPTTWKAGDTVTSAKLNKIENSLAENTINAIIDLTEIASDKINYLFATGTPLPETLEDYVRISLSYNEIKSLLEQGKVLYFKIKAPIQQQYVPNYYFTFLLSTETLLAEYTNNAVEGFALAGTATNSMSNSTTMLGLAARTANEPMYLYNLHFDNDQITELLFPELAPDAIEQEPMKQ